MKTGSAIDKLNPLIDNILKTKTFLSTYRPSYN